MRRLKKFFMWVGIVVTIMLAIIIVAKYFSAIARTNSLQKQVDALVAGNDKKYANELSTKVESLEKDNSDKDKKIKELKQKIKNLETVPDNRYLQIKFPTDGNLYKEAFEVQYFADPECTKELNDVTFLSPEKDTGRSSINDLPIYILRTEDGGFCYCPQNSSPYLITEEKWKEMQEE